MEKRNKPQVIIADDQRLVARSIARQLEFRRIEVVKQVHSAHELLEYLELNNNGIEGITAILVDFVMPDMKGKDLVERLIKGNLKIPIIVLSGMDIQGSIEAYTRGAYAIMQKPIDGNELAYTIHELAKRNELAMELAAEMRAITEFDSVLVWELDWERYPEYKVTGYDGLDHAKAFIDKVKLNPDQHPQLKRMEKGGYLYCKNINDLLPIDYQEKKEAVRRGWVSLLSFPFFLYRRMVGWIDCYKNEVYEFRNDKDKAHKIGYLRSFTRIAGDMIQATRLREQSRIIHETNQNLAGTLQEELIYNSILKKALDITLADCGWIYRYDAGQQKIVLAATFGEGAEKADEERILSYKSGGITGLAASKGISLNIKDVSQADNESFEPENHIATPGLEEKSILAVPMRRGERTLGVITVKSRHKDFFKPDDVQFITSLAAIAAVGMERQKLMKHLEEMSRLAQTASDFDQLARFVVKAVSDLTDAEVNLWMMSSEDGEGDHYLRLRESTLPPEKRTKYQKISTTPDKSFSGRAMHTGCFELVADVDNLSVDDANLLKNKTARRENGFRSLLIVPLIGKNNEKLGVVSLSHKGVNKFSEDDAVLVQAFANQVALALQEQRHFRILQELTQIGQKLTTTFKDTKSYLQKVVDLGLQLSRSSSVVIYPYDPKRDLFYDNEFNVSAGETLIKKEKLTEKPRKDGLSALIRSLKSIRVEGEGPKSFELYAGELNGQNKIPGGHPEFESAVKFFQQSKFIEREKIQSFIGVSLVAEDETGGPEEVAVMFFNYRAPRHFVAEELQVIDIFCKQVANVIQRNRLFNTLEKERNLIEGVHASAVEILEQREQQRRLDKIVAEAVRLLQTKGGKMYLIWNGSQRDLKLMSITDERLMEKGTILKQSDGFGLELEVVRRGKPIIENDYANSPHKIPDKQHAFSAVVEVPMKIRGEVIGVLGVFDDKDSRKFYDADVRVLEKFAAQAALAVYNIQLYDELDALFTSSLEIVKNAALKEISNRILEQLKRVIDYDSASIQRIHSLDQEREVLAQQGVNIIALIRPPEKDKLVFPIIQKQKAFILSDTRKHPDWDSNIEATKDVRSWAGVPLVFDRKTIGLLALDHKIPGYYTDEDIPKLERFALQAAIGLNNAIMYEELNVLKFSSEALNLIEEIMESSEIDLNSRIGKYTAQCEVLNKLFKVIDDTLKSEREIKIEFVPAQLGTKGAILFDDSVINSMALYKDRFSVSYEVEHSSKPYPIFLLGEYYGDLYYLSRYQYTDNELKIFQQLTNILQLSLQQLEIKFQRKEAYLARFNPYTIGAPVKPQSTFFGRQEIINSVLSKVQNNHFIIQGERRIGKTSLLHSLKHYIQEQSNEEVTFFPIYIDLEGTEESVFWSHIMDYIQKMDGLIKTKREKNYDFRSFQDDLDRVLSMLASLAPSKIFRLVFLLDEVDVFKKYSDETLAKFRKLLSEQDNLKTVMAGVEIKRLIQDDTSPWYNMFNEVSLGAMSEAQARRLIEEPVHLRYTFIDASVQKILTLSKCKPYFIQYLCANAVENMLNRLTKAGVSNPDQQDLQILPDDVPNEVTKLEFGKGDDTHKIEQRERSAGDKENKPAVSDNIRNPYIVGSVIRNDNAFYNRKELMYALASPNSQAYYLKGNRRVGKTSVLFQLGDRINQAQAKQIAIYFNLEGAVNEKDLCSYLIRAYKKAMRHHALHPVEGLEQNSLIDLITRILDDAAERSYHCFLLIDEAEQLKVLEPTRLNALHRILVNSFDDLTVVISGTNQLMSLSTKQAGEVAFLNNFVTCYIGNIPAVAALALVRQSQLPEGERPVVPDAVAEDIVRNCGGHPFLLQRLCSNLFENGSLREIRPGDLLLDGQLRHFIETDFNHLSEEEQEVLFHFYWRRPKAITDLPASSRKHLSELEQLGFLKTDGEFYELSNIFLAQWLDDKRSNKVQFPASVSATPGTRAKPAARKLFISYSKEDKIWLDKLKNQLRIYEREEMLIIWDDSKIKPGQLWEEEISGALDEAHIIIFLVSANMLATDYVMDVELPRALQHFREGTGIVLPVIMRPCSWTVSDFRHFQALPEKGKPVSTFEDEDVALAEVVRRIEAVLDLG